MRRNHFLTASYNLLIAGRRSFQLIDSKQFDAFIGFRPPTCGLAAQLQYFLWDTKRAGVRPF
jgi:hypothetical protein